MNIELVNGDGSQSGRRNIQSISIELDNGNRVLIYEIEPGVLHIQNITTLGLPKGLNDYGIMIAPQNYSTVHIIPEG